MQNEHLTKRYDKRFSRKINKYSLFKRAKIKTYAKSMVNQINESGKKENKKWN